LYKKDKQVIKKSLRSSHS